MRRTYDTSYGIFYVLCVVVVVLVVLTIYTVADSRGETDASRTHSGSTIIYEVVEIEGMPCITAHKSLQSDFEAMSISCDWSKWRGEIE